jgi:hypothetical protein
MQNEAYTSIQKQQPAKSQQAAVSFCLNPTKR